MNLTLIKGFAFFCVGGFANRTEGMKEVGNMVVGDILFEVAEDKTEWEDDTEIEFFCDLTKINFLRKESFFFIFNFLVQ